MGKRSSDPLYVQQIPGRKAFLIFTSGAVPPQRRAQQSYCAANDARFALNGERGIPPVRSCHFPRGHLVAYQINAIPSTYPDDVVIFDLELEPNFEAEQALSLIHI